MAEVLINVILLPGGFIASFPKETVFLTRDGRRYEADWMSVLHNGKYKGMWLSEDDYEDWKRGFYKPIERLHAKCDKHAIVGCSECKRGDIEE